MSDTEDFEATLRSLEADLPPAQPQRRRRRTHEEIEAEKPIITIAEEKPAPAAFLSDATLAEMKEGARLLARYKRPE